MTADQPQKRLTFVALNVSDLGRSVHFCRDLTGIQLAEASHDAELEDPWWNTARFHGPDGNIVSMTAG